MKLGSGKTALFLTMIALLMMTVVAPSAIACCPEPPQPYHLKGPATLGHVLMDGTNLTFSDGQCQGQIVGSFTIPYPFPIENLQSSKDVVGAYLQGAGANAPFCYDFDSQDLVVEAVSNFKKNYNGAALESIEFNAVILGTQPY